MSNDNDFLLDAINSVRAVATTNKSELEGVSSKENLPSEEDHIRARDDFEFVGDDAFRAQNEIWLANAQAAYAQATYEQPVELTPWEKAVAEFKADLKALELSELNGENIPSSMAGRLLRDFDNISLQLRGRPLLFNLNRHQEASNQETPSPVSDKADKQTEETDPLQKEEATALEGDLTVVDQEEIFNTTICLCGVIIGYIELEHEWMFKASTLTRESNRELFDSERIPHRRSNGWRQQISAEKIREVEEAAARLVSDRLDALRVSKHA